MFSYAVILIFVLLGGILGTIFLTEHSKKEIYENSKTSLYVLTQLVNRDMEEIDKIARILSTSPGVIAGLSQESSGIDLANKVLDRYAEGLVSAVCYVLDLEGSAIASSNRHQPDSFVGQNYSFRSYFQEAIAGKPSRLFLIGKTSRKKGYYSSCPIYDSERALIGVVVVKKDADALIENFQKFPHSFLIDPEGTIFFSDTNNLDFLQEEPAVKHLFKSPGPQEAAIGPKTLVFNKDAFKNGQEITLQHKKYFIFKSSVNLAQWDVVFLASASQIRFYQFFGMIVTTLVCCLLFVSIVIIYGSKKASRSDQLLASVVESSDDAIIVKTLDSQILSWNKGAEKIYGYESWEMVGKSIAQIIPQEKSREMTDIFARIKRGDSVDHFETVRVKKDGTPIDVSLTVSPIKDSHGNVIGASTIARDITSEKKAEKALVEAQKALQAKALGLEKTNEAIKALYKEIAEKTVRLEASQKEILKGKDIAERIYKVVPSAIFTVDKERRVTSWNNKAAEITGYTENEILGKSCEVFCHWPCKNYCGLYDEDKDKPLIQTRATICRKDKEMRTILKNVDYLKDLEGNVVGGIESFEDMTDQFAAEEKIKESEEKYRHLVENANSIILRLNAKGNIIFFNEYAENFFGYKKDEVLGKPVAETIVPSFSSSGQDLGSLIQQIVERPQEHEINENENICKNGKRVWVRWSNKVVLNEKTKEQEILCVGNDITTIKKAQEQLFKLSRAVEQSPATVVITDTQGNIEYVNPKFCHITGYSIQEALGQNPRILKSGDQPVEFYKDLWDTILKGEVWRGQFSNKKKNGEIFYEEASISAVKDEKGRIINFIAVKEDVTDKRATEEKAKEAMRMKSEFISVVSHELRTPLTAIKEGISIVADGVTGEVNKDQQEFLDVAKRNVDRLSRLINDVLDFQKLDAEHISFELSIQNLNDIVGEVVATMSKVAEKEGVSLSENITRDLPLIKMDKDRITQVLTNLVNNAIKYAPGKPVVIKTSKQANTVTVSVVDHGEGIKEEDLDKLFQTFSQLKRGKERKTGSTGLGLAISKKIIEQHNGKIWVESTPGQGAAFSFLLPIAERRRRG